MKKLLLLTTMFLLSGLNTTSNAGAYNIYDPVYGNGRHFNQSEMNIIQDQRKNEILRLLENNKANEIGVGLNNAHLLPWEHKQEINNQVKDLLSKNSSINARQARYITERINHLAR